MDINGRNLRLRIYVGENKRHGEQPLYEAIVRKARQLHLAGATVGRGTMGFGRSTRLHTTAVTFSDDLPVVVEMIDSYEKIHSLIELISSLTDIALVTCDEVRVVICPPLSA
jgi:PII-like signaling protein